VRPASAYQKPGAQQDGGRADGGHPRHDRAEHGLDRGTLGLEGGDGHGGTGGDLQMELRTGATGFEPGHLVQQRPGILRGVAAGVQRDAVDGYH
jgi:hypothetical protein